MKKHKFGAKERKGVHAVIFGIGISAASFLVLTLLASAILMLVNDPLGTVGGASLAVLVLSSVLTAFLTVKFKGDGALIPTLISSLAVSALIIVISIIAGGGEAAGSAVMNAVSYLLPAALVTFLATRKKPKQHGRFR